MRLKKTEVAEREAFILEEFKKQPDLSVRAANDLIIEKFGKQMKPKRILEIRRGLELLKIAEAPAKPVVIVMDRSAEAG